MKKSKVINEYQKMLTENKAVVIDTFKFKEKEIKIYLKKINNSPIDEERIIYTSTGEKQIVTVAARFEERYIIYSSIAEMGILDIDWDLSDLDLTVFMYAGDINDDGHFDLVLTNEKYWFFTFILSDEKGKYTQYLGSPKYE